MGPTSRAKKNHDLCTKPESTVWKRANLPSLKKVGQSKSVSKVTVVAIWDYCGSLTAHKFRELYAQNYIQYVEIAVATPRANGQVEHLIKQEHPKRPVILCA